MKHNGTQKYSFKFYKYFSEFHVEIFNLDMSQVLLIFSTPQSQEIKVKYILIFYPCFYWSG